MRLRDSLKLLPFSVFQSTHSLARMRRLTWEFLILTPTFQSTHSLARMRHLTQLSYQAPWGISIHALPRKNATLNFGRAIYQKKHFNPRTPSQECDSNHYQKSLLIPSISYPYCTPPLSKTQPLYFHRTIFSHKSPISQCESSYIFMFT